MYCIVPSYPIHISHRILWYIHLIPATWTRRNTFFKTPYLQHYFDPQHYPHSQFLHPRDSSGVSTTLFCIKRTRMIHDDLYHGILIPIIIILFQHHLFFVHVFLSQRFTYDKLLIILLLNYCAFCIICIFALYWQPASNYLSLDLKEESRWITRLRFPCKAMSQRMIWLSYHPGWWTLLWVLAWLGR